MRGCISPQKHRLVPHVLPFFPLQHRPVDHHGYDDEAEVDYSGGDGEAGIV